MANETDLTFAAIVEMVRGKSRNEQIITALDHTAGLLLLLSPAALGPIGAPALALLEPKNELVRSLRAAMDAIHASSEADGFTRVEVLSAAYCILSYSAFFEALDTVRPSINRGLKLTARDRARIAANATRRAAARRPRPESTTEASGIGEYAVSLPHPAIGLAGTVHQLELLYSAMAEGVRRLIRDLAVWDQASEATRDKLDAGISALPDKASKLFSDQYLRLCSTFDEFAIWANLGEHELTRRQITSLSHEVQALISLGRPDDNIDVGLQLLGDFCGEMREHLEDRRGATVRDLATSYESSVREPIILDDFDEDPDSQLRYPSKLEIFVPQAFKVLPYERGLGPIEDERLWHRRAARDDIGPFLLRLLSSPYSDRSPIVVLGHPGSGKSLLTEVLAARLAVSAYTPIRVELRDVNADSEIQNQIEEQVRRDTGREATWVDISESCADRPPLVILDGYDELLQASGRVFSTYLNKVAQFQAREASLNRPVRVLVTSRITLIDKAEIPRGTTFVRLEEFDEPRQAAWIDRWNLANALYFEAQGVHNFALPRQTQIQSLASQPLLLLMLALFDSASNGLRDAEHLNRSTLYDTLLRRFIVREKSKGEQGLEFRALSTGEQELSVNLEMRRLGVAAIGMFNRKSLHLSQQELESDIAFFETGVESSGQKEGVALSQADLLLGSFFFVHESRSRTLASNNGAYVDELPGNTAFEFLHNTFGEFLTANMILRELMAESKTISAMLGDEALAPTLRQRLSSPNGFPKTLLVSLMCTSLLTRPVIVGALREWSDSILNDPVEREGFEHSFSLLYGAVTERILAGGPFPSILSSEAHPYPSDSTLEAAATLTLNLTLVGASITRGFRPGLDTSYTESQMTLWERLTYLWRAGFGTSGLDALGQMIETEAASEISLHLKDGTEQFGSDPVERLHSTSNALNDRVLSGLTAWGLQDVWSHSRPSLAAVARNDSLLSNSLLAQEAARRELMREASSQKRNYDDAVKQLNSWRGMPSRSSAHVPHAALVNSTGQESLAFTPDVVLGLPPEVTQDLWRRATDWETLNAWRSWSRRDIRNLLREHPSTAADILAASLSPASGIAGYRSTYQMDFLRQFRDVVASIAASSRPSLPAVVAVEFISSAPFRQLHETFIGRFLGKKPDVWAIASRPSPTVRRLLHLSGTGGAPDVWVKSIVASLARSGPDDSGPRMLLELGMVGALSVLQYSISRGQLDEEHRGLGGIIPWMFANLESDDPVLSATLALNILSMAPPWISDDITAEQVLRRFGLEDDGSYEGWVSPQVTIEIDNIFANRVARVREQDAHEQ